MDTNKTGPCGDESWDEWGDRFGKKMEHWAEGFCCEMEGRFEKPSKMKRKLDIGGAIFALFLLSWGVTWFGNSLGYWQVEFPFWPVAIILIAVGILVSVVKKAI